MLQLFLVRAVVAAARMGRRGCCSRAGTAAALIGVVEARTLELNAIGAKYLVRGISAGGAGNIGMLGHAMGNFENVSA